MDAPQKSRKKRSTKGEKHRQKTFKEGKWYVVLCEALGLVSIALACITFLELGIVGKILTTISLFLFGNMSIIIPLLFIIIGLYIMLKQQMPTWRNRFFLGTLFIMASMVLWSHSFFYVQFMEPPKTPLSDSVIRESWRVLIDKGGVMNRGNALGGGMVGALLYAIFHKLFAVGGTKIMAGVLLFIGIMIMSGRALLPFAAKQLSKWRSKLKTTLTINKKPQKRDLRDKVTTVLEKRKNTNDDNVPLRDKESVAPRKRASKRTKRGNM